MVDVNPLADVKDPVDFQALCGTLETEAEVARRLRLHERDARPDASLTCMLCEEPKSAARSFRKYCRRCQEIVERAREEGAEWKL